MTGRGASVLWTDQLDWPSSAPLVGAKLGRLAALARAGLRTPGGFVVPVDAFHRHLAAVGGDAPPSGDPASREVAPDEVPPGYPASRGPAPGELAHRIRRTALAPPLADAVLSGYARLGERHGVRDLPVAVRSSMVAEDGVSHSFAGVCDSFLGVTGPDALLAAVAGCWASAFGPRALAYRKHAGLSVDTVTMAVGVLELIPARVSGVAFSVHPVTGSRDRMVLEYAPGLGAAVGGDSPGAWRAEVDKVDGRVLRRHVDTVAAGDTAAGDTPTPLAGDAIARVAETVRHVERVLRHPVDVEWVVDPAGDVWVVQARPITVAGHLPGTDQVGWDPTRFLPGL